MSAAYRCLATRLLLRETPGEGADTGRRVLYGQVVRAHGSSLDDEWLFVEAPAGLGWASAEYLQPVPEGRGPAPAPPAEDAGPAWQSRFGGREWAVHGGRLLSRDAAGVRHVHGTYGEPLTVRRYLACWGEEVRAASRAKGVPVPLLLATLATENGTARAGPEKGLGFAEPRYRPESGGRLSVGPCHVLIGTARATIGDRTIDRRWLSDLGNNLLAAASYIRDGHRTTGWEPILVAARYNAGGVYDASSPRSPYHSRWHVRAHGDHLDRFAEWYGDALRVV